MEVLCRIYDITDVWFYSTVPIYIHTTTRLSCVYFLIPSLFILNLKILRAEKSLAVKTWLSLSEAVAEKVVFVLARLFFPRAFYFTLL